MLRKVVRLGVILFGLLVLWVALVLFAGTVAQLRVPVDLSTFSVSAVGDDYVRANGTWVIEGQKQAFPLQTTEIWCEREMKRCTSATAQVVEGALMFVDLGLYDIISWEKSRIVFVDDSPGCVRYVYTIDPVTKFANGVRKKKTNTDGAIGDCTAIDQELRLSLKSGFLVVNALREEALPWYGKVALAPLKLFR